MQARVVDEDAVDRARAALPPDAEVHATAHGFALLADPGRVRLLLALRDEGGLCVRDLAAATGQGESAVSHALGLLRAHRIVSVTRSGRLAVYRLDDAHVRMLLDAGLTHTRHVGPVRSVHAGASGSVAEPT